jgi:phospholipase/carboxylesterase
MEDPPNADLSNTTVLVLGGRDHSYGPDGAKLANALAARGARVNFKELPSGHSLTGADVVEASVGPASSLVTRNRCPRH